MEAALAENTDFKPFSLNHPDSSLLLKSAAHNRNVKSNAVKHSLAFQYFTFHAWVNGLFYAVDSRGSVYEAGVPSSG